MLLTSKFTYMKKKLEKLNLSIIDVLSKEELKNVKGGAYPSYQWDCVARNGSNTRYFSTQSNDLKASWVGFWETAGYSVTCLYVQVQFAGGGGSGYPTV
ncbi:hypothetical protein D3C80_1814240 [compost metagenome]